MKTCPFMLSVAFLSAAVVSCGAALSPTRLRCELLDDPAGIDEVRPRLSWVLAADKDARGQKQTAYRVVVASSPEGAALGDGDLWDTGKVASDQTLNVEYAGKPLASQQQCWWAVRVWDRKESPSDWSRTAHWSMGLLNAEDWAAKWIGKDEGEGDGAQDNPLVAAEAKWIWHDEPIVNGNAPLGSRRFVRTFSLPVDVPVKRAEAWLAADNTGTVQLNGRDLGGTGSFKQARLVDLAPALRPGENTLTITVTNVGDTPNPAGLLGVIQVAFSGALPVTFVTDAQWLSSADDAKPVQPAKILADVGQGPWGAVAAAIENRVLPARRLRKSFALETSPARATVTIVGLGYYELYLNGKKVGDHVLDPILTDYEHRVPYVVYDVTERVTRGENVVGVILGNGRYYAPRLRAPTTTKTYGYPRVLFQLDLTYADGRTERVVSDASWRLTDAGPIRENNDYDGEVYDARRELPGWCAPGFDDSAWETAGLVAAPLGRPVAAMMPPMRVTQTLKPVALSEPKPGVWVYDLGQNIVGWCRVTVDFPVGWTVTLRHAERLAEDGTLYVANLRGAKCRDVYISNGAAAVYEPRFTYHGFRYAELTLSPPQPGGSTAFVPTLDTLVGRVVHTDMPLIGSFETSHALINRIHKNIEWGVRGNYLSIPTDCPQRDERQGWQGDRAASSLGEMFLFDNATLYRKWMQDIADSQRDDGVLSSVCPKYWPMYPGDVTWPSAFTIVPRSLHLQVGDTRSIEKHYGAMVRWLKSLEPHIKDGILERDTYGDWCVPPERPDLIHSQDPKRKTSKAVLATAYYIYNLSLVADYADMLRKSLDAARFRARAKGMTRAFNERFLDAPAGRYDNGTQTASILPLAFGIVPEAARSKVADGLVSNILVRTDGHIGTGLIGGQWLNRVLTAHERPDICYRLVTNTDYPSWGYMVENGATTIWELWNGNTANPAMNSGNHVMLVGDLVIWFYETLAGIKNDPGGVGFKRITMQPCFVEGLDFVRAGFDSVRGRITSHWRREGALVTWDIRIPPNTTAEVRVPARRPAAVTEGGRLLADAEGVKVIRRDRNAVVCDVQSGTYRFVTEAVARP